MKEWDEEGGEWGERGEIEARERRVSEWGESGG